MAIICQKERENDGMVELEKREPVFASGEQGPGMQITVYYGEEDHYLIRLLDQEARRQRKSRSAVVLSILEEHFEREKRIGEILVDLGQLSPREVEEALQVQRAEGGGRRLGEILLERGWVDEGALSRALLIQDRYRQS